MIRALTLLAILTHLAMPSRLMPDAPEQVTNHGREVALALSNDLIQGIATASCDCDDPIFTVQMNLQAGRFAVTDSTNTSTQTWSIPPGTKLTIDFRIDVEKKVPRVLSPVVKFNSSEPDPDHPGEFLKVSVEVAGSSAKLLPSSISYGTAIGAEPVYKPQNLPTMTNHLSISTVPAFIFKGNPFRTTANYLPIGSNDPLLGRPLITEVIYPAGPEGAEVNVPPIAVTFRKDTVLTLAGRDAKNPTFNTITLTGESKAKLKVYHYWTQKQQVYLAWSDLELHLSQGSLNAAGFSLAMQNGSLMLDKLQILSSSNLGVPTSDPRIAVLAEKAASAGSTSSALNTNPASGATISFGDSVGLVNSSESDLTFKSLNFSFVSGSLINLSAQGISSKMKLLEARLGFGDRGNLKFGPVPGSSSVELKLRDGNGVWADSAASAPANSAFQLTISDIIAAPVLSGKLVLFPGNSALEIDRGSIVTASELRLSPDSASRGLSGSFSGVSLKLKNSQAPATITINDGLRIKPGNDVTVSSEATDPLTFRTENAAVAGRFNIQGNFPEVEVRTDARLGLRSFTGSFDVRSDGMSARALTVDISAAAIGSVNLSFLPVGTFELNSGSLVGKLELDEANNRYVGTLRLSNFAVNSGMVRLNPQTTLSVTSVGSIPTGVVEVGSGTIGKVKVQASGLRLAAKGPSRVALARLLLLENSADAQLSSDGQMKFNPDAQYPEGNYSMTGSGVVRIAETARVPLVLSSGKVQMSLTSAPDTGANLAKFSAEGNGVLVNNATSVPVYLKLTDATYSTSPSDNISANLEANFRPTLPGGPSTNPRFPLVSYAPPRTHKKQPKLFPLNFNFSFGQDSAFAIQVSIDTNGVSSREVSNQSLLLSVEVLAGTGIYKYAGDQLGANDRPTGHDKTYDDKEAYKPFKDYQEMLRVRVNSDCKASSMIGTKGVFQVPVATRLSIIAGSLKMDFSNQVVGPVPISPDGTTLLLLGCSNSSDVQAATTMVAGALHAYLRQHPLLNQAGPLIVQPDTSPLPRQHISKIIALSIVDALTGQPPRLQFTLGMPKP
jgi:hypothetical protein